MRLRSTSIFLLIILTFQANGQIKPDTIILKKPKAFILQKPEISILNQQKSIRNFDIGNPQEQYETVFSTFKNWKGVQEQIDDVTVMGIKIK